MFRLYVYAGIAAILYISCSSDKSYINSTDDPILFCKTVKQLNDVVLENNFPPMIAARNYAYAAIAAYEAMIPGSGGHYATLSGQIKHLPAMPAILDTTDINFHLASLLSFCQVGTAVTFSDDIMNDYVAALVADLQTKGMPKAVLEATRAYADTISNVILDWARQDNYSKTRSASKYTVTNEAGTWIPTPPMYAQALEAHWNEIRPMLIDSATQFKPIRPPVFSPLNKESVFHKAVKEVQDIVDSLSEEQKAIALFWDDNPFQMNVVGHAMYATKKFSPPGHWMNIVGIIGKQKHADFETMIASYATTAIAMFDGFISCWDEKYRSNFVRPVSVINEYFNPAWQSFIQTPPFPEYTSGHAVISAAAAEVMTDWYGENVQFNDTSLMEFGIEARSFNNVRQAAKEAAVSRVYGGIHYRYSCITGNEQGIKVGQYVLSKLHLRN
jgi:hypothetical protein